MTARVISSKLAGLQWDTESSWNTDPASTYTRARLVEDLKFVPEILEIPLNVQKSTDMCGPEPSLIGPKGGTLTFKMPVTTVDGSESPVMLLMKNMGFTQSSIAQSASVIDSGTSTTIVVTDAEAASAGVAVGQILHHDPASGTSSMRGIEKITDSGGDTTIHVNEEFLTTPTSGDSIQATDTIIPQGGEPDNTFTFHIYLGQGSTNRYRYKATGCSGTWKIGTFDANGIMYVEFEFKCNSWTDDESNVTQTNASGNSAFSAKGAKLYIDGSPVNCKSFAFDPGLKMAPIECFQDADGRQGWFFDQVEPTIEIDPLHDIDYMAAWEAGTTYDLMFEKIISDTDSIAIWIPKAQIVGMEHTDDNGFLRMKPKFKACDPGYNDDTPSEKMPLYAVAIGQ